MTPRTLDSINEQYWTFGKNLAACAKQFGISEETMRRDMVRLGIPRRSKTCNLGGNNRGVPLSAEQRAKISAARKALYASGDLQHWNSGRHCPELVRRKISKTLLDGREPAPSNYGPDWHIQRTSRLQFDDFKCQDCGATDDLEVHHWEPYRFCFDNSIDNLVTLCAHCHLDMHERYRREGWMREAEAA